MSTMNLGELVAALQEMQKVAPNSTTVNVVALRLKAAISISQTDEYGYGLGAQKREQELSLWLEVFTDGPMPASCPDPTLHYPSALPFDKLVQRAECDEVSLDHKGGRKR